VLGFASLAVLGDKVALIARHCTEAADNY